MEQWLNELFTGHGAIVLHSLIIITLVLAGLGVPFPEELIFLAVGYAGEIMHADVLWLCVTGLVGIMLGDSLPYMLGRKYGLSILGKWPFNKLLTASHIDKTKGFFERHGSHTVFIARFLAGVRMPTFFMAGAMGMTYPRFFINDFMGAMISCPTSIYLAYTYGRQAKEYLAESHNVLIVIIVCVAAFAIFKIWRRPKKSDSPPESPVATLSEAVSGPDVPPPMPKPVPAKVQD